MKVLVVGGGGREHALAWRLAASPYVREVWVAPGNAGTTMEAKVRNIAIAAEDVASLKEWAVKEQVDLTIVGPEAPIAAGIADVFAGQGLRIFAPSAAAGQLESSKAYCKGFLKRHEIPTGDYAEFERLEPALAYIEAKGAPIVVKADGLASGKGVVVATTIGEAQTAARAMLGEHAFGQAGARIVIEEVLEGEEASFIGMVAGEHVLPFASSQDHKARDDGDRGPNTGGMGAYSPAPVVTAALHERVMEEVMLPAVRGMAAEGNSYLGFLYAGLMIDVQGNPKVLEFNCRLGDPEAQVLLMRLKSDLALLCLAALDDRLDTATAEWDARTALGVVMASAGYPGSYATGATIRDRGRSLADGVKIFHSGTTIKDGSAVTSGGRVLCVTALGKGVERAQRLAYESVENISFDGAFYRGDIGWRALD